MRRPWRYGRTAFLPLAAVLIGALLTGPASYAEERSSAAHGDGKGSAAPAESGDHGSAKGVGGEGVKGDGAKSDGAKSDAHPSSGVDGGRGPQGGSIERVEPANSAVPSAEPGKDTANVDTRVEPVRRLDRNRPGQNQVPHVPGAQGATRRLSPLPQAPNPVRNSIGVVVPPAAHLEPREGTHLPTTAARPPSVTTPIAPGNALARPGKPELASRPAASPAIMPPVANRGAINGTGVTRHSVGPPRIGGPAASVAGINGTTIRSKH
jgi:hypothetical protein